MMHPRFTRQHRISLAIWGRLEVQSAEIATEFEEWRMLRHLLLIAVRAPPIAQMQEGIHWLDGTVAFSLRWEMFWLSVELV